MILFQNITKRYDGRAVLKDVDLQISGGEFVTLIGPSGAGKSTLIHALIGALKPNRGMISVDGFDITDIDRNKLQDYRRKIGIVFQDFKLLPKKTVFENIAFAMEVCGAAEADTKKKVKEVLEIVNLTRQQDQFPHQLSGGEKQRTAIGRALVHDPKLFIADEPTGNLDPESAEEVLRILQKINISGTTVILATHNQYLVDNIRKRVILMKDGVIIKDKQESGYNFTEEPEFIEII
ncbi:cell division ATP-binding protein FtsE [Candidatus Peregrinibacteria bacterium CG22_combo_CG10-13_8_21_14_all_44_10]|nr:MAG: cell division ATP-binding protein FtsE [Candidatus Peregrinibacteria bacterium CG2_30_44_17]PIP65899.1 MAG: cell division ATP-binding protein FtsE [Candidatus Peregrinibacteria bacterium CG22_combo_CG10-13_8_21_14_all_44_10]PIX80132.1 MAG: cell division ATP-binding protein FtsE [Candidatus Peregrinibacteria bacterium CG_4_10_14_3_um_filter_44_21]PJB89604.1 MAG: cell division ATP-binding protein FtsE [Candidatus Peregrinibacteria bacterium CG_4_9_14_0_8_um_filter_44_15]